MRPSFFWNSITSLKTFVTGVTHLHWRPSPRSGELKVKIKTLVREVVMSVSPRNRLNFNSAKPLVSLLCSRGSHFLLITHPPLFGQEHLHSIRQCVGYHKNIGLSQRFRFKLFPFIICQLQREPKPTQLRRNTQ